MLAGERNVADEAVALPQHKNFLRRLDKIEGFEKQKLAGHATGPAARLGIEGKLPLSAQQFIVGFLYLLGGPGLQDRVLRVHYGNRELAVAEQTSVLDLAVIGIGGIGLHRPVARTRRAIQLIIPE